MTCPRPPGNFCSRVLGTLARSRGPLKALRLPQPRVPGPMCVDAGPYLQPLDAIAHIGLERQGEEQRLADLRPRPHPRAAGAPGGRTLGKPRRSPAARPAAVAPPARTPPAVGESGDSGLRLRAGRGPRRGGGGAFYSNYKGGVGARGGRARGRRSLPPRTARDAAGVWLELNASGARPRDCPPSAAPAGSEEDDRTRNSGETRQRHSERERDPQRARLKDIWQREKPG